MEDYKSYTRKNSLRYHGFDYSSAGYYFVTICTNGKKHILSEITENGENSAVQLSDIGKIVNEVWHNIPEYYDNVQIEDFVVMPNHIHGIIVIGNNSTKSLSDIVNLFKSYTRKRCREICGYDSALWHRGFYDEIIETEDHYYNVKWYITCNPRNWKTDEHRQCDK